MVIKQTAISLNIIMTAETSQSNSCYYFYQSRFEA